MSTLSKALQELRSLPGNRWQEMDDPLGEAHRRRYGDEPAPDAGLREFTCDECGASASSTVGYVRCDAPACGMRALLVSAEGDHGQ